MDNLKGFIMINGECQKPSGVLAEGYTTVAIMSGGWHSSNQPISKVLWEVDVADHSLILAVEHVVGDYKITVKRTGEILLTPMPGKEAKPLEEYNMPPQKFWVGVSGMIKNMTEQIARLSETNEKLVAEISAIDAELGEERKKRQKIIPVGTNKKEMFAA